MPTSAKESNQARFFLIPRTDTRQSDLCGIVPEDSVRMKMLVKSKLLD